MCMFKPDIDDIDDLNVQNENLHLHGINNIDDLYVKK